MTEPAFSDYVVFVDESGDHSLTSIDENYPVFVLCFCIVHKHVYSHEITPAIRDLKCETFGHDLVILHEHDIRKKKGDFRKLGEAKRAAFMERLSGIIEEHEMTIVAMVIDKPAHKAKYINPHHPYHLALQFGLERIRRFLIKHGQKDKLTHIIFEARGPKEDTELELEFRRVIDAHPSNRLPFDIRIISKLSNSEDLQLADITARPIGLSVIRPNQENRAFKIIEGKLFQGDHGVIRGNGIKIFPTP